MGRFDGKVALVTGGGVGIGRAAALAFASEGAKVVIGNRNADSGAQTITDIQREGGEAIFVRTDVSQQKDVQALVETAVTTYGGVDVAFNNAGIEGDVAETTELTEENFDRVMSINVKGVWLCMKYQLQRMLEQGHGGAIVNNSSVAGLIGFPGLGHYVASKHAVVGLTKCAALEYSSRGIRVNAVNPAVIETAMSDRIGQKLQLPEEQLTSFHPIGRLGQAPEVADAVLWLCSQDASFVTGISLPVDGGFTAQ